MAVVGTLKFPGESSGLGLSLSIAQSPNLFPGSLAVLAGGRVSPSASRQLAS